MDPYGLDQKSSMLSKRKMGFPDMELSWWDFAGQLEYSAAHDFFISSRQAVYVIIFSVTDDRDSQMNQVACASRLPFSDCFFTLNNAACQVLAAHRVLARVAACAFLYCGDQGGPDPWQLGRFQGRTEENTDEA